MRAVFRLLLFACCVGGLATESATARPERAPLVSEEDSLAARLLVAEARVDAGAERHHASAHKHVSALRHDIRLVDEVAREIAYQKLWRDDADEAIFYFRRHLIRSPDAASREVHSGLALALSWSGQQDEAIAIYRDLVAADPDDGAARIGLGRSLLWDNRLREGFAQLHAVEQDFPRGSAPRRDSSRFLLQVLDGYTPPYEFRAEGSRDSDDLEFLRLTALASAEVAPSLILQAIPSWAHYEQGDGQAVSAWRFGGGLIAPLARNWRLRAYGWLDRFRSDAPLTGFSQQKLSWDRPGGDLWFTWRPVPGLRTDFGASLLPVETLPSLAREIYTTRGSASLDWRLGRSVTVGLSGQRAGYSDDNRRWYGAARLTWRREGRVHLSLSPVLTYLDFARHYPGTGYWSPGWMRNGSLEAVLQAKTGRWTWRLSGRLGREKEQGADVITVGGAAARVGWRLYPEVLLLLEGGHSRSRLATSGGYSRDFLNLSLRGFF